MQKKAFLVFTIVMVFLTGTVFYRIIAKTEDELRKHRERIVTDTTEKISSIPPQPPALPDAAYTETGNTSSENSLTKGQKYFTSLVGKDSQNILLAGLDPTYTNFDAMILVCINEKEQSIVLVNLPRDIYIHYSDDLLAKLKKESIDFYKEKGNLKMNAAPAFGRKINYKPENERFPGKSDMNFLSDLIHEIFNIEITDYVKVQTKGFREVVDFFGGVTINVPYSMHYEDPEQNLYIHLEPGPQLLNGTQAEGFVRFRQGYARDGQLVYYSRSENTLAFLKAFYEQHVNIKNISRAGKIFDIIQENTATSVNRLADLYRYVRLSKSVLENNYSIESVEIQCEETKTINGALYMIMKTN